MEFYEIEKPYFVDYFKQVMAEELNDDFYTLQEFKALVNERIYKLQSIGYNIFPNQIARYEIVGGTKTTAGIWPISANTYKFVIAKAATRRKNEKYLNTIIYHELCHILQLDFLFNQGLIFYKNNKLQGNSEEKDNLVQLFHENNGHTSLWHAFANKLNKAFLINPPIAEKLEEKDLTDIFLESFFIKTYEIEEPDFMKNN